MATVSKVDRETCTRKTDDDEVQYTCYRPTYTYGFGRGSYTKLAESTVNEPPSIGEVQKLHVWQENPAIAKKISKAPQVAYNIGMLIFGLLFVTGAWLLISIGQ